MRVRVLGIVLALLGSAAGSAEPPPEAGAGAPAVAVCLSVAERARLLALDQQQFDQDMSNGGGGWRALENRPGCERAAADLIRDFRKAHGNARGILSWHEGQLRAAAGDYEQAVPLLDQGREPGDSVAWNLYADATIAFLRRDRAALLQARERLAAVQPDAGVVVTDGTITVQTPKGDTIKIKWPPNLEVVDALVRCFDKPYKAAYSDNACRAPAGPPH